jgi:mannose-6-phosphate isomerase-like protein (cupin superfamily)
MGGHAAVRGGIGIAHIHTAPNLAALKPAALMSICVVLAAQRRDAKVEPMTFALDCAGGNCQLLKGVPQTSGMRGGSVRLRPGENVGWHSTSGNEEALVVLHGKGVANIEGHADVPLREKMLAYIPPATRAANTLGRVSGFQSDFMRAQFSPLDLGPPSTGRVRVGGRRPCRGLLS